MSFTSFVQNVHKKVFSKLSGDMSGIFIGTTIIGYLASAGGQLYGISKNDKVAKDKKKFMRFQEMADCAVNILAYFTITKGCTKLTKSLASSGKILPESIVKKCNAANIDLDSVKNIGAEVSSKLGKLNSAKDVFTKENIKVSTDSINKIDNNIKALNSLKDEYTPFEQGMSMLGTIGGGLLSADFIAPVLRNKYASIKQKQQEPSVGYHYTKTVITNSGSMKI